MTVLLVRAAASWSAVGEGWGAHRFRMHVGEQRFVCIPRAPKSARGLAQSKTLARMTMLLVCAVASWSAVGGGWGAHRFRMHEGEQ